MMGSKGSGGGSSNFNFQNTSSTYTPAPSAMAAYNQALGMAENVASIPFQQYGGQMVAGFSPDQQMAFEATRQMQGMSQPYINAATNLQGQAVNFADPRNFNQQTLSQYMNPYQQDVVNATMANLGQLQQQQQNELTSRAIKAGAMGGDRTGIARAALAGQQNLANAQTLAQLQQQGYSQAMGQYNQQQQRAIETAQNAAYGLGQLGGQAQNAALTGIQALLGTGAQQQQLGQQQLTNAYNQWLQQRAYPYQQTAFYSGIASGIAPNMGGTTNTVGFGTGNTQMQQPSGGGGAAGIGMSLLSMLPQLIGMSDEDDKTDIKYLGRDPETGEKLYSYRYKGDPKTYPKVVGPMAQDIEEEEPERVHEIGGHKVVEGLGRLKPSERENFQGGGAAAGSGSAGLGGLSSIYSAPQAMGAQPSPSTMQAANPNLDPGMGQFLQGYFDPRTAYQAAKEKWVNNPQSLGDDQYHSDLFQIPPQLMQDGGDSYPYMPSNGEPRASGGSTFGDLRHHREDGGGLGGPFDLLKQGGVGGPYAMAPANYMAQAQNIGIGKIIPPARDVAKNITESAAESMQRSLASEKGGGGGGRGEGGGGKMPEIKMPKHHKAAEHTTGGLGGMGEPQATPELGGSTGFTEPALPAEAPVPAAPEMPPPDFGSMAPPLPEIPWLNQGLGLHLGAKDGGRIEFAGGGAPGVPAGGGRAVTGSGGGLGDIVLGSSPSWSDLAGFGELSAQNAAMTPDALRAAIWKNDPGPQLTPEQQGMPAMPGEEYYKTPQERLPGELQSRTQGNQNPGLDPAMMMFATGGKGMGMNLGLGMMLSNQARQQAASNEQKALQEKRAAMLAAPRPVEGYFQKLGSNYLNPRTGLYNMDYTGAYYGMPFKDGGRVGKANGGALEERKREAMKFFLNKGYSVPAAAGIVANLVHESDNTLNPSIPGDYVRGRPTSFGIAQWHGDRIKNLQNFAQANKSDWRDFKTQLAFVDHELKTGYRDTLDKIMSSLSPQQAASHMVVGYENPTHPRRLTGYAPAYHGYLNRVRLANQLAQMPLDVNAVAATSSAQPAPWKESVAFNRPAANFPHPSQEPEFTPAPEFKPAMAGKTPAEQAAAIRQAEAQAAAQRNQLASASRKPGFSLSNFVASPAMAADQGVYPEGARQRPPMRRGSAENRVVNHPRTYGPGHDTYAPGISERTSIHTAFGDTARQGDMPGEVPYAQTMVGSPMSTKIWDEQGFTEPQEQVAATDRTSAQPKQMYWGDYRDVENNPLGDFIDELAGDVRGSAKPGTATTPMGKYRGPEGGLGALFDLEGTLPYDVQPQSGKTKASDEMADLGSLFDIFG
jgi:hypothetical protein